MKSYLPKARNTMSNAIVERANFETSRFIKATSMIEKSSNIEGKKKKNIITCDNYVCDDENNVVS